MAAKKAVRAKGKKAEAKPAGPEKSSARREPVAEVRRGNAPAAPRQPVPRRPTGPTAQMCPLVLDGELAGDDFSPSDCLTCSEFDCRFCETEEGSGALRSRLFAGSEESDGDDAPGSDFSFDGDAVAAGEEVEGEGEGEIP